jgi:hypothetical protein
MTRRSARAKRQFLRPSTEPVLGFRLQVVNLRRALTQALILSLIFAAWWSWSTVHGASITTVIVTAAILFVPVFGFRLIIDVGGELLADERRRKRAAGTDDRRLWT